VNAELALFAHALGALRRRLAKVLALAGGLSMAVALLGAVVFLTEALRAEAARMIDALPDVLVQRLVGGRPAVLDKADAPKLQDIPSVRQVTPRVWGYIFVPALQGNVTVLGLGDGEAPDAALSSTLGAGRPLVRGAHEMMMGEGLARHLGLHIEDVWGVPSTNPAVAPMTLVGTFHSKVDMWTADVLLCDEADARAMLLMEPHQATDFAVRVANPAEARIVAKTITERLPGSRVVERDLLMRVYTIGYGRRAGLVLAAALPTLLALLVLAWDRVSGLSTDEKREIVTLKAVGFSVADVVRVKMYEATVLALGATATGLVLAYAWVFLLGAPGLRPTLVGWSVLYPEGPLVPEVDGAQLLGLGLAVAAPYVALSIVPAWRAAIVDPAEALRT
jgi:ABC-type lipoprotein release transport system permease subunit